MYQVVTSRPHKVVWQVSRQGSVGNQPVFIGFDQLPMTSWIQVVESKMSLESGNIFNLVENAVEFSDSHPVSPSPRASKK